MLTIPFSLEQKRKALNYVVKHVNERIFKIVKFDRSGRMERERTFILMPDRDPSYSCDCEHFVRVGLQGGKPCAHWISVNIKLAQDGKINPEKLKFIFGENLNTSKISNRELREFLREQKL